MLRKIRIQNYKSILDDTIELGRINVFIGENGCGKSNLLEAVAMAEAALRDDLDPDALFSRGIRLAKPELTMSAFPRERPEDLIRIELSGEQLPVTLELRVNDRREWVRIPSAEGSELLASLRTLVDLPPTTDRHAKRAELMRLAQELERHRAPLDRIDEDLRGFACHGLSTQTLRGVESTSRREPLGIHGEGLDTAIASLSDDRRRELVDRASCIAWMEDVVIDVGDRLKARGFKPGRGTSTLYFVDRFMAADNNVFSAENANEGVLHILFYLTLFMHEDTPRMFGIDNIETALNPQLCRDLTKQLAELAQLHDKQALITTHNPAILDGLNLHDDDQRLFVVERTEAGHTRTRRIVMKPNAGEGSKYKLSELWMRGYLGGLPRGF